MVMHLHWHIYTHAFTTSSSNVHLAAFTLANSSCSIQAGAFGSCIRANLFAPSLQNFITAFTPTHSSIHAKRIHTAVTFTHTHPALCALRNSRQDIQACSAAFTQKHSPMHSHRHSTIAGGRGGGRAGCPSLRLWWWRRRPWSEYNQRTWRPKVNTEHDCTGFVHACVGWGK